MAFELIQPKSEEEWLEIRTTVLTATDMGVVLGLNKWKSVKQLVDSKKEYEPLDNSYIWLGQVLEPVVVQAVNKVLGTEFELFEEESRSFFIDKEIRMGATPDAEDGKTLLECKSTKPGNYLKWHGWPPAYYVSQLYTQLIATDRQVGYLAILGTDLSQKDEVLRLPLHVHKLTRTPELDKIFIDTAKEFWKVLDSGKMYRVKRKDAPALEMKLRLQLERIYG